MVLAPTLLLNAGSGAAIARPTFSRDFAGEKTLNNGTGPAITFTRGSNATYFDASGTLRLAPHNLLLHSESLENAVWSKELGATVSSNTTNDPNGSQTADTITFTTTNANRVEQQFGSAVNNETLTFSVWLKGSGTARILLDTTSGVGGATEINITLSSTWTRHTATVTYSSPTGNRRASIIWRTSNTATSVDAWGAQVVFGSIAGEYFATTSAAASMPRFDHDPATGASRGLLIEESRTNSIRNSQAGGSTNGVIGSGGVMPTNWSSGLTVNGLSTEILGTGTEDGLSYIDLKISGTPTTTSSHSIVAEPVFQIVASNGQTWTNSCYVRLIAGALTNATLQVYLAGRTAAAAVVSGQTASTTITPTSATLRTQRYSATLTMSSASVERVSPQIIVNYTNAQAIDLTLRIAAPQLEQGAFPTSYIPTTSAAVTRSADSAVVTPMSSFYNQSEGTFVTATNKSPLSGSFPTIWHLTNGTDDVGNVIGFYNPSNSTISYDASPAFSFAEAVSAGLATSGFAFSATSARMAVNGVLEPSTDQSATITTDKAALRLGAKRDGSEPLNGHIRRIAYFPKRLSNALLQSLTT